MREKLQELVRQREARHVADEKVRDLEAQVKDHVAVWPTVISVDGKGYLIHARCDAFLGGFKSVEVTRVHIQI